MHLLGSLVDVTASWALGAPVAGPPVPFGPGGETLPAWFTVQCTSQPLGLEATLKCGFNGDRVTVNQLWLESRSLTPRDLSAIQMGGLVHQVAISLVVFGPFGALDNRRGKPLKCELDRVATLYQRHYATWGKPRQAVMDTWGLPTATANFWLRRARSAHQTLPDRCFDFEVAAT